MKAITLRQAQVLVAIQLWIREHGWPPTVRELGAVLDIKSTNGVQDHLRALKRKGLIEMEPYVARGIRVVQRGER